MDSAGKSNGRRLFLKRERIVKTRRRTAGSESRKVKLDRLWNEEAINKRNGFRFDLEIERDRFLRLPGCAHPCAESGGMGRGFVMGVMRGMGNRLWIHDPAQDEQADG